MYDLFISYKSSDRDIAKNLLDKLLEMDSNLSIFWSEKSLQEIGNADYTAAIENAIKNSKNMIVVGSVPDNFFSKWVSYEWKMFKHLQLNDNNNFYNNLLVAGDSILYSDLPIALQMCECINLSDTQKILKYLTNHIDNTINETNKVGLKTIQGLFNEIGWVDSILLTSQALSEYENSISNNLMQVTILSHSLKEDSPGGALFNTVHENLKRGIKYNYIFLDEKNAFGVLRNIKRGHNDISEDYLILETAQNSFWALGTYSNVTIYEFSDGKAPEGYLRVMVQTYSGEKAVYLKMSESFINTLWNNIEDYRVEGFIKKYSR